MERAAGTFKQGYGFHPLTAWCTNIGDSLAVQLRPGNAGSFTASDHLAVFDAAIAQIPAAWRADVLVTIDGAGASHEIIDHLTGCHTAAAHGRRGRRVEYSIGWPVDERTLGAVGVLGESDWGDALHTDGAVDPGAKVAELTGILRRPGHDRLATWPADLRILARRVPRPAGKPAKLGEDADWEYGAFATNTPTGQLQWLDARHRTQAHVEDRVKQLKACGARNLPSIIFSRGVGRGADLRVCVAVGVLDVTRRLWGLALFNGFVAATSGRVAAGALPQDAAGPCISEGLGEGVA